MKILQILPYYAPAWGYGGPPRVMFDIAKGLASKGHDVTVYTTDAYTKDKRIDCHTQILNGVKIYYFPNISNCLAWNSKKFFPVGFRSFLKKTIKTFDLVHISGIRNYLNIAAYPIIKRCKIPYVIDAHGSLPVATGSLRGIAKIYDIFFVKPMLRNANALFAQTQHEAERYKSLGGLEKTIKLMPLAVDLQQFGGLPDRKEFRLKYNIKNEEKVIAFLGRINAGKGLHLLIDVFVKLTKEIDNIKLVIIGRDDGYLSETKILVKNYGVQDKTIFAGPLYGTDKISVFRGSDIFVFTPIYWEETSAASLEALACYLPVVSTKQAEIPWLEEYQAGYCVSSNIEEILLKVKDLISSEERLKLYSRNARKLIEEKYDLKKRINEIEKNFQLLIYGKDADNV